MRFPGIGPTKEEIGAEGKWGDVDSPTRDGRPAEGYGARERTRWATSGNEWWVSTEDAGAAPGVERARTATGLG